MGKKNISDLLCRSFSVVTERLLLRNNSWRRDHVRVLDAIIHLLTYILLTDTVVGRVVIAPAAVPVVVAKKETLGLLHMLLARFSSCSP